MLILIDIDNLDISNIYLGDRVINKMEMESQIASLFLNRIKYQREVLAERVMENRVIKVYQFSKITFNIMQ